VIPKQRVRRVAYNFGLLAFTSGLQTLLGLILIGLVARYLGIEGFGRYGFVVSLVQLFVLATLGFPRIIVREVSRRQDQTAQYLGSATTLLLIAMTLSWPLSVLAAHLLAPELQVTVATGVYFLSEIIMAPVILGYAVFRAHERMEYQAVISLLGYLLQVVLVLVSIYLDLGLIALFVAMCVANVGRWVMVQWALQRGFSRAVLHWDSSLIKHLFLSVLPVSASFMLRAWLWRGGIVLLTAARGEGEAGLLYGPLRVAEQLMILPNSLVGSLMPVLSHQFVAHWRAFVSTVQQSLKLLIIGGLVVAFTVVSFSDQIVLLLFGPEFPESSEALRILAWTTVLTFPNLLLGATLVALDEQTMETVCLFTGLIITLSVSMLFAPDYGLKAICYAILLGEATFSALSLTYVWRRTRWTVLPSEVAKISASAALGGAVVCVGRTYNAAIALGLGLLVFMGCLLLFRGFDEQEIALLKGLLSSSTQDLDLGARTGRWKE
jgi:O-antigen/teichoic acid export membrane protein